MADAVEVEIHGHVQGVGFRYSCQVEATRLGVCGWARNNDFEGTVSAHFEGDAQAVEALVDWCRLGPPSARVSNVELASAHLEGYTRFTVTG